MAGRFELTLAERKIYRKYAALPLPRHTSYPIAPVWKESFQGEQLRAELNRLEDDARLSLYVHVPYCEQLCYYCACTKEIVPAEKHRSQDPSWELLAGLELEAQRFADAIRGQSVAQVHLGGGSPTFLSFEQLHQLWRTLSQRFSISNDAEIAVEVDPRITTPEQLQTLRSLGFNRISLGVQDFSPKVQQAVNRIQPFEMVESFVAQARDAGFASINFDLIYGLPYQTLDSMSDTIDKTIRLAPDRIAFYRLAVIPDIFRWQKVFQRSDMPTGDLPLDLNLLAINRLTDAGYLFIGLDHFAKPDEQLSQSLRDGRLRRNFQGMTTAGSLQILGLGPSAITQLDSCFAQNQKSSQQWRPAVERGFATERGLALSPDDRLRRELLQQFYGWGCVDKPSLERRFDIVFDEYFADELHRLTALVDDGLVVCEPSQIRLTECLGRLLVRVAAAVFDRYLPPKAYLEGLPESMSSKVG